MKKNMGNADRIIRLLAALTFIILYFTGILTGWLGIVLIIFSVVFTITSVAGVCPMYSLFGMSTCSAKKAA